jgi:uncharacterized protein (UPF0276 family)
MKPPSKNRRCQGAGIGLRPAHLHHVLRTLPKVPWLEVHSCNFLGGGLNRELLEQINQHYPLSFHGVNLNLGGVEPLDYDYLSRLRLAIDHFKPTLISDHACFTAHDQHFFHDLMPVPYTEQAASHMAERIIEVQNFLGQRILLENVSRYFSYPESQLSEGEFLAQICAQSECGLVLDLNNAYVNFHNHGDDVDEFITALPLNRVAEIHLAGHSKQDGMLIDTHNQPVCDEVWDIYRNCVERLPNTPSLIEWDSDLPDFSVLIEEQNKAAVIASGAATLSLASNISALSSNSAYEL